MSGPGPTLERLAEERFRLLVEHSPDMLSLYDRDGRFAYASAAHARILGHPIEALLGRSPLDFLHPDDVERVATEIAEQIRGVRPVAPVEFRFRCLDGRYRWLEAVVEDLTGEEPVGGILVASRDVTGRKRAEAAVQAQSGVLERIVRGAPLDAVVDDLCRMVERWVDGAVAVLLLHRGAGMRVMTAPSAPPALRAALDRVSAQPGIRKRLLRGPVSGSFGDVHPHPRAEAVLRNAGLNGWWAAPVLSSDGGSVLGTMTALVPEEREPDAIERELLTSAGALAALAIERDAAQGRLAHQATHDALTGLPNREHLVGRLRELGEATTGVAAVLFLDLDRFKVLNDSAGHDVGDRILVAVARRLRSALRDDDAVARFGGDEFVVGLAGLADVDEVMSVARRMLEVVSQPYRVGRLELVMTASIGVALVDGSPPEALLRDADTAMYHAKERGRARVELFDGALRAQLLGRMETEQDLRRALDGDQLVVHYQPVMSFRTGRFACFESLVRWEHPTSGTLVPDQFLDVAEEAGLMVRLGELVQRRAFGQAGEWRRAHPEWGDFVMGVNLSAAELRDAALPSRVAAIVAESGADPSLLGFEASEHVLASDTESIRSVLAELRAMGMLIALDDFGTGTSPLLHLRRLPIHAVKLDGVLVARLGMHRDDNVLVAEVIRLAHRLGLFAVAEGVEDAHQARRLQRYGCLLAQGHHFAPAMPADAVEDWVAEHGLAADPEALLR